MQFFHAPVLRSATGRRQRGLTIIEVLVGLTISLFVSIAIFQALITWSQRTRTSASGGEAQIAGTLGLYRLDRDLKHAGLGFGLAPGAVAGCDVAAPSAFTFPLSAVRIVPGGSASEPDEIRILYGNSTYLNAGVTISTSQPESKQLVSRAGFQLGDWFVAAGRDSGGTLRCRLLEMTGTPLTGDDGRTVEHKNTTTYNYYYERNLETPGSRTSSATNNTSDWTGGLTEGWAYNLGPQPELAVWTVGGSGGINALRRRNELVFSQTRVRTPTADLEVVQGVVNLKAQYGVDANGDNRIAENEWTTTNPTDWSRLRAIRFALLVRGQNFEPPVDGRCLYSAGTGQLPMPSWFGTDFEITNIGGAAGSPLNASDWRCYRYNVYERVVSLRNMIWGTSSPL